MQLCDITGLLPSQTSAPVVRGIGAKVNRQETHLWNSRELPCHRDVIRADLTLTDFLRFAVSSVTICSRQSSSLIHFAHRAPARYDFLRELQHIVATRSHATSR
jgi:hypothetical protein